jgi:hypothetical protein
MTKHRLSQPYFNRQQTGCGRRRKPDGQPKLATDAERKTAIYVQTPHQRRPLAVDKVAQHRSQQYGPVNLLRGPDLTHLRRLVETSQHL